MPTSRLGPHLLDARPDRQDIRDLPYRARLTNLPPAWPRDEDLDANFKDYLACDPILDQGSEGACTGFGLAAVINFIRWAQWVENKRPAPRPAPVSARMLYENARLYDEWEGEDYDGSSCRGAMKGWHKHGVTTEKLWPYLLSKDPKKKAPFRKPTGDWAKVAAKTPLGAYYRIDKTSLVDLQSALLETRAIYVSADVHAGWRLKSCKTFAAARITQGKAPVSGGHAFALVGYSSEGFYVQNSWGPGWGFNGFAVLPYDDWLRNATDAWVAAIGVQMNGLGHSEGAVPTTRTTKSLTQSLHTAPLKLSGAAARGLIAPWSDEDAHKHCILLGNDGLPKRHLITSEDGEQSVIDTVKERVKAAADSGKSRIVIYAHGGINSEEVGVQRAARLGPWFDANGIEPIFIVWKTGIAETLLNIIEDAGKRYFLGADAMPQKGLLDEIRRKAKDMLDKAQEALDRTIEAVSAAGSGRMIWQQMKDNAAGASMTGGGMQILARELGREIAGKKIEVHVMGHSAGAILLGHALKPLRTAKVIIASTRLMAPACTIAFTAEHYGAAMAAGQIGKGSMLVDAMTEAREQEDRVAGVYGKSLLYLVSRGCERHKTPLLGLQRAWPEFWPDALDNDIFGPGKDAGDKRETQGELEDFSALVAKYNIGLRAHADGEIVTRTLPRPQQTETIAHGSFDNDIAIVSDAIAAMLDETKPAVAVTDLTGY